MTEMGVDGFKTDRGEHVWDTETHFHNGMRGSHGINTYPMAYERAYQRLLEVHRGKDHVLFSRAGYTGPQQSPVIGQEMKTPPGKRSAHPSAPCSMWACAGCPLWAGISPVSPAPSRPANCTCGQRPSRFFVRSCNTIQTATPGASPAGIARPGTFKNKPRPACHSCSSANSPI